MNRENEGNASCMHPRRPIPGFEPFATEFSAPGGPEPLAASPAASVGQRFALLLLCFYVLLVYTRTPEILALAIGTSFKIATLTLGMVLLLAVLGGQLWQALTIRESLLMFACTAWFLLSVPFSVWKGGSAATFVNYWINSLLLFLALVAITQTLRDCRYLMYALALGLVTLCLYLAVWGTSADGRLALQGSPTLANPNLLAMHLEFGLPFCFLLPMRHGIGGLRGLLGLTIALISLIAIGRSGSRAALVALAVMLLVWFWEATPGVKLALVGVVILVGTVVLAILPESTLARYRTLVVANPEELSDLEMLGAYESSMARKEHLRQSLKLTAENPLFGVGLGMFTVASAELAGEEGKRAAWRQTHNTFTQVSSEAGLPALLFYLLLVGSSVKSAFSLYRATRSQPHLRSISQMSFCLLVAQAGAIANAMFSSVAYQIYFPLLAGISVALARAARASMQSQETGAAAPTPVPRYAGQTAKANMAAPGRQQERADGPPERYRPISHL